jgi:hypothetical protein
MGKQQSGAVNLLPTILNINMVVYICVSSLVASRKPIRQEVAIWKTVRSYGPTSGNNVTHQSEQTAD